MSLVEEARGRLEEVRAKGVLAALEEKFPKIKEIRGGNPSSGGILGSEGGILATVRERGVLGVLEERFPRIREFRGGARGTRVGAEEEVGPKGELPEGMIPRIVRPPPVTATRVEVKI